MLMKTPLPAMAAAVAMSVAWLAGTAQPSLAFGLGAARINPLGAAGRASASAWPAATVGRAVPRPTLPVMSSLNPGRPSLLPAVKFLSQGRRNKQKLASTATWTPVEADMGAAEGVKIVEAPGKGIMSDIKAKAPLYKSDITDGLNLKVLSSVFFLFFACLAPAVAFGGLLGIVTEGAMGPIEMIAGTAVSGILYALASGQPLTIIGSTGPVLAFIAVLYKTAGRLGLPFLPMYAWVGFWTAGILAACSLFSVSNMVEYFTRFTDEIFSLLISVIFILEACKDIAGGFTNPAVTFTKAVSSLVIALLTYNTATIFRGLRGTPYMVKPVREVLADFGPTIGVFSGIFAAVWAKAKYGLVLPTLNVPASFTTTIGRPWLVPVFSLPVWARFAAAVPALMASVLLFMDQNITVRLVNSKEHKLKKGYGMHLDMLMISGITAVFSALGMPWLVAATVRSLAHVKSLGVYEQKEGKEVIAGMTEQRVSGVAIHTLIGSSILFLRPQLARVPLAVLMGLFLYLGVSGLKGNQLFDRTKLLVTDPELRPKAPWTTDIPMKKTNIFTLIQLACLWGMMWVKGSPIGVLFPVIIALLAPIRFALERPGWFSKKEMAILDTE